MFDIGFWELVVIGFVALLVFGPERLPQFARRAGYWIGRARRQLTQVRSEIEREIALDEMRETRKKIEAPLSGLANDIRSASSFQSARDRPAKPAETESIPRSPP